MDGAETLHAGHRWSDADDTADAAAAAADVMDVEMGPMLFVSSWDKQHPVTSRSPSLVRFPRIPHSILWLPKVERCLKVKTMIS